MTDDQNDKHSVGPSELDPALAERNQLKAPVDDPPICERFGCGHLIGIHTYNRETRTHGSCTTGCRCAQPILRPYRPTIH